MGSQNIELFIKLLKTIIHHEYYGNPISVFKHFDLGIKMKRIKLLVLKFLINLINSFEISRNLYLKKELTSKLKKVGMSF